MEEGLLTFAPRILPLQSIFPTSYLGLQQCGLREAWRAAGGPPLLPSSPAARVGTAIHRLLQEAGRARFRSGDGAAVDRRWGELITAVESGMRDSWLERHLIPLSRSVPELEVRRIHVRERALELSETASAVDRPAAGVAALRHGCELPVSTPDGRVRGRIDAVVPGKEGPVLRDYKSGAIFEPGTGKHTLKGTYEAQLRMYAALYAMTTGIWPARLEIVPILGAPEPVSFDRETCSELVAEARRSLDRTNEAIASAGPDGGIEEILARPAPETCKRCAFRPGCRPYRAANQAGGDEWPRDTWGRLNGIVALGVSRMIQLNADGREIRIRGLGLTDRHPAIAILENGDQVGVFNARRTGSPSTLSESSFTTIYKLPEQQAVAGTARA